MARVILTGGLTRHLTGGKTEFEVDAKNVRALIRELDARYPGLGPQLESEMSVAIDGEIHNEPFLQPVAPASEVCFVPRLRGG